MYWKRDNLQKGQALLIIILIMVAVLTIGLSVATRNVHNLRTAVDEESTQQAFSAAEAGIEQALKSTTAGNNIIADRSIGTNARIKEVDITTISGQALDLNEGNPILKDDGVDIWLSEYGTGTEPTYTNPWPAIASGNGTVRIAWGTGGCPNVAALSVVVISDDPDVAGFAPQITHYTVDPCATRRSENNFGLNDTGSYTIAATGKTYSASEVIPVSYRSGLLMRIVPLYASSPIGIEASHALPSQGTRIESTGQSGQTQRKIVVVNGYPKIPVEFFPYIIFSPGE